MSTALETSQMLAILNSKLDLLPGQIAQAVDQRLGRLEHKMDRIEQTMSQKIDDVVVTQKTEMDKLKKSLRQVQKDVGGTAEEVSRLVNVTSLAETKTKVAVLEVKAALEDKVDDLRADFAGLKNELLHTVSDAVQRSKNEVKEQVTKSRKR